VAHSELRFVQRVRKKVVNDERYDEGQVESNNKHNGESDRGDVLLSNNEKIIEHVNRDKKNEGGHRPADEVW
jgi:hypothetical protein